jgi:hypothetical protein
MQNERPPLESFVGKATGTTINRPPLGTFVGGVPIEQQEPGFIQSVAQAVAHPFLRASTNLLNAYEAATTGKDIQDVAAKSRDFGYFGEAKPIGQEGTFGQKLLDTIGLGTEMASIVSPIIRIGGIPIRVGSQIAGSIAKGIAEGGIAGALGGGISSAGKSIQEQNTIPETLGNIVFGSVGGGILGAISGGTLGGGSAVAQKVIGLSRPTQFAEKEVNELFQKAIKPSVSAQKSSTQLAQYQEKTIEALKAISENRDALKFERESGVVSGKTPETLGELVEGIGMTKENIFKKYDSIAREANGTGVKIGMDDIVKELQFVAKDDALAIARPEAAQYALRLSERLQNQELTPTVAQRLVEIYNKDLQAFYKNPSPDKMNELAIDAMVANRLRAKLDAAIEQATGKEYQALKNQYGALKAIEADVNRRNTVFSRQQPKGLIDFGDMFSGAEVIRGIINADPGAIASGATVKAIQQFYKKLNSPDRAVKKMFDIINGMVYGK